MRTALTIDTGLLLLILAVTVARGGYVLAAWEQGSLWPIGYVAQVAIDLTLWRFAYLWRRSAGWRLDQPWRSFPWTFRLLVVLALAVWSGGIQWVYMQRAAASALEALLLSAIWPLAIIALAVNEGLTVHREPQAERDGGQAGQRMRITRSETVELPASGAQAELPSLRSPQRGRTVRRYSEAERLAAIAAAHTSTVAQAAREAGIPERTLGQWVRKGKR